MVLSLETHEELVILVEDERARCWEPTLDHLFK